MGKLGSKWPIIRVFSAFPKVLSLLFSGFSVKLNFILLALCLHKSHIWESSSSRLMSQNAQSQSDHRILKLAISQEKANE